MTRKFGMLAAAMLTLSFQFSLAVAQDERGTEESAAPRPGAIRPLVIVAVPTTPVLSFHPAAVGIAAGSAQKLTASFEVSGYSGSFTPTATFHYGHDYTSAQLGAPSAAAAKLVRCRFCFYRRCPAPAKTRCS